MEIKERNVFEKCYIWFRMFFASLFRGMKAADNIMTTGSKEAEEAVNSGIEQAMETNNVLQDLLRGELTQEVMELRHEMYHVERESKKYRYVGGGQAEKRNRMFEPTVPVEKSDGLDVWIIQDNNIVVQDVDTSMENSAGFSHARRENEYTLKFKYKFDPRFKIDSFTTKIVLKKLDDEGSVVFDLYFTKYTNKIEYVTKLFHSEMERIFAGSNKSDILDFESVSFTSKAAYGVDDLVEFEVHKDTFDDALEFDGSYVLRFTGKVVNKHDIVDDFYCKEADENFKNHAPRKNAVVTMEDAALSAPVDKEDNAEMMNLIGDVLNH